MRMQNEAFQAFGFVVKNTFIDDASPPVQEYSPAARRSWSVPSPARPGREPGSCPFGLTPVNEAEASPGFGFGCVSAPLRFFGGRASPSPLGGATEESGTEGEEASPGCLSSPILRSHVNREASYGRTPSPFASRRGANVAASTPAPSTPGMPASLPINERRRINLEAACPAVNNRAPARGALSPCRATPCRSPMGSCHSRTFSPESTSDNKSTASGESYTAPSLGDEEGSSEAPREEEQTCSASNGHGLSERGVPRLAGPAAESEITQDVLEIIALVERECAFLRTAGTDIYDESNIVRRRRGVVKCVVFYVRGLPWAKRARWLLPLLWSVAAVLNLKGCVAKVQAGELYAQLPSTRGPGRSSFVRLDFAAARDLNGMRG
jgi:hypothetical protein